MSTRKEMLVTQLRACHNEDGWFAPLNVALRGVTAEQAVQGGAGTSNSIYGIVHHLVFWNERYLRRFFEGTVQPLETSNTETFQQDKIPFSWDELQAKADNTLTEWEQAIQNCDEAKLDSQTHPDSSEVWWVSLANLAIHNAYHIGQIVHIRKTQGTWQPWEE